MHSYNVPDWKVVEDRTFPKLCRKFEKEEQKIVTSKELVTESETRILMAGAEANYSCIFLLHSIASGRMLGDTKVVIVCYVERQHLSMMQEMANELKDCSLPLLTDVVVTSAENEAFKGIHIAILLTHHVPDFSVNNVLKHASTFRTFKEYGRLFNLSGSSVKILVVSEPTLINAQILRRNTTAVPPSNIASLSLPLMNIVKFQSKHRKSCIINWKVASKMNAQPDQVKNIIVWGQNTSSLTFDLSRASFNDGGTWKNLQRVLANGHWIKNILPELVTQRIISCWGENNTNMVALSKAICEQMHQWWFGLADPENDITRMGVESDGSFGLTKGLYVDLPVRINSRGQVEIATEVEISPANQIKLQSMKEKLLKDINLVQSMPSFQNLRMV